MVCCARLCRFEHSHGHRGAEPGWARPYRTRRRRLDGDAVMTLSELLVAACITTLVVGAAIAAITPLQRSFAAQPEAASLSQRTRVVAELLAGDLRRASLVMPLRFGAVGNDIAGGVFHRDDVVT